MLELKHSTVRGKRVVSMGLSCKNTSLEELYKTWSREKEQAFCSCKFMFADDKNAWCFRVGNANTFGFTCSWLTIIDDEEVMRVETKDNSYLVWLER